MKKGLILFILLGPILSILYMNAEVLPTPRPGLDDDCPWDTCGIQIARRYINSSTLRVPESRITILGINNLRVNNADINGEFYQSDVGNYVFLFRSNVRSRMEVHGTVIHEFMHGWAQAMDNEYSLNGKMNGGINVSGIRFNIESRKALRGSNHYLNGGLFAADELLSFRAGYLTLVNMALDSAYAGRFLEAKSILIEASYHWDSWQKLTGGVKLALSDLAKYVPGEEAALLNSLESANLRMTMCRGQAYPGRTTAGYQVVLRRKLVTSPQLDENVGLSLNFPLGSVTETTDVNGGFDCKGTSAERAIALKEFKRILGLGDDKSANEVVKALYWDASDLGTADFLVAEKVIFDLADKALREIADLADKQLQEQSAKYHLGLYREYLKRVYIKHPIVREHYRGQANRLGLAMRRNLSENDLTKALERVVDETNDKFLTDRLRGRAHEIVRMEIGYLLLPGEDAYPFGGGLIQSGAIIETSFDSEMCNYYQGFALNDMYDLCLVDKAESIPESVIENDFFAKVQLGDFNFPEMERLNYARVQKTWPESEWALPNATLYSMDYYSHLYAAKYGVSKPAALKILMDRATRHFISRYIIDKVLPAQRANTLASPSSVYISNKGQLDSVNWSLFDQLYASNRDKAVDYLATIIGINFSFSGRGADITLFGGKDFFFDLGIRAVVQIQPNVRNYLETKAGQRHYKFSPQYISFLNDLRNLSGGIFPYLGPAAN